MTASDHLMLIPFPAPPDADAKITPCSQLLVSNLMMKSQHQAESSFPDPPPPFLGTE